MSPNPLILDTDGGIDDAQALVLLMAHGRAPEAVTTVFGNVPLEAATRNMIAVLTLCGGADVPVITGQAKPMSQPIVHATHVHGEDGLGGADIPADLPGPAGGDAPGFLAKRLRSAMEAGEKVDLLMIGPLTNLAVALLIDPEITAGIGHLTIMGGTLYGRGNTTPAAEFNIFADPEAADIVFGADIPTVVVAWEPCTTHYMDGAALDAILDAAPDDALGLFNRQIARRTRDVSQAVSAGDVFRYVDPFAAAVVIEPGLVTGSLEACVGVALAPGLTRGMTLVDPSGRLDRPKVTFVETADNARLDALYRASLEWRPA